MQITKADRTTNNFGIIRLIGAFLVFSGHEYVLLGKTAPALMGQPIHRMGIIIFFLTGGYVITQSWERDRNIVRYLLKRIMRIVPPLVIYTLVAAYIIGPLTSYLDYKTYFTHPQFTNYFKNIFLNVQYFLPGAFAENPYPNAVNGSLWSLPAEFVMYLLIPVIYEFSSLFRCKKIFFTTSAAISCLLMSIHETFFPSWHCVVYATDLAQVIDIVPFYFIGAAVAVFSPTSQLFSIRNGLITLVIISCFSLENAILSVLLSTLAISYVFYCFTLTPSVGDLKNMEISYGIYLYGFPIQQTVIYIFMEYGIPLHFMTVMIISFLITATIAFLSRHLIENPSSRFVKRLCARIK